MKWDVEHHAIGDTLGSLRRLLLADAAHNTNLGRLRTYFSTEKPFTGAVFELFGADAHGANEIGCHDLLSLSLLSTPVDGKTVRYLHENGEFQSEVSRRLTGIHDQDIWDAPTTSLDAANELSDVLDGVPGLGETRVSKLLCRKRPRLIPISDAYVRDTIVVSLSAGQGGRWTAYRAAFRADPDLLAELALLRDETEPAGHLSLLRILDVIAWMKGREKGLVPDEEQDASDQP
jgi:hypothetical protein